jgi:hypothetical protein
MVVYFLRPERAPGEKSHRRILTGRRSGGIDLDQPSRKAKGDYQASDHARTASLTITRAHASWLVSNMAAE